MHNFIIDDISG